MLKLEEVILLGRWRFRPIAIVWVGRGGLGMLELRKVIYLITRPDTRLPKSRAGGQGPYLRSPNHLGRSSEVKEIKS